MKNHSINTMNTSHKVTPQVSNCLDFKLDLEVLLRVFARSHQKLKKKLNGQIAEPLIEKTVPEMNTLPPRNQIHIKSFHT